MPPTTLAPCVFDTGEIAVATPIQINNTHADLVIELFSYIFSQIPLVKYIIKVRIFYILFLN